MLGVLGIITAGLINVGYFIVSGYLSFIWSNGDENRLRKYHNRFAIGWLVTAVGLYVYSQHF